MGEMRLLLSSFLLHILLHFLTAIWGLSEVAVWSKDERYTAGRTRLAPGRCNLGLVLLGVANGQSWLMSSRTFMQILGEFLMCRTLYACSVISSCLQHPNSHPLQMFCWARSLLPTQPASLLHDPHLSYKNVIKPLPCQPLLALSPPKRLLIISMCPSKSRRYVENQMILMKFLSVSFKCSTLNLA